MICEVSSFQLEAALGAPNEAAFTGDMLLSMALWKAVADRHDLLVATWDSGRVGATELERLSTLVWGRLDATPTTGSSAQRPAAAARTAAALAVSLPEACRLSDALAASLRARLGVDPSEADHQARLRSLRASVERVRDLVDREPAPGTRRGLRDARPARRPRRRRRWPGPSAAPTSAACSARWSTTPPAPSATSSSAPSNRRADAHDEARARALRAELEARGAALRDLAARCVAAGRPRSPLRRARRRRRSGPCPPSPRPWTPTWCGWTPSAGR